MPTSAEEETYADEGPHPLVEQAAIDCLRGWRSTAMVISGWQQTALLILVGAIILVIGAALGGLATMVWAQHDLARAHELRADAHDVQARATVALGECMRALPAPKER